MKRVLLLVIFLRVAYFAPSQDKNPEYQKLARDIFKELIEINTTSRFGSTKAAEAMAERLKSAGFPDSDIHVIGPDQQHKNMVFRFRGSGKLKPVLFICHLDVVEALHQDWSTDPFTFLEKDEYFYGRGTTDVKNDDASLITNVIRLKKEGFIPNRDIIIALTADNNPDNVMSVLKSVLADSQISVTRINSSFAAPLSPLREDVTGPVNQISSSMLPGVNVTPIMSTGATDGRYLRRQGIPVYGVSGMFGDMDDVRAHGKDERIGVKEFYDGVEFMYRFIKVLSSENNHNH